MDSLYDIHKQGESIINKASFLSKDDFKKAINFLRECERDDVLKSEFELAFKHNPEFRDKGLYLLISEYKSKIFQYVRQETIKRRKERGDTQFQVDKGYSHELEAYYNAALLQMSKERKEVHKQGMILLEQIKVIKAQIESLNNRFNDRWDTIIKFKQEQTREVEYQRSDAMLELMQIDEVKEPGKAAELKKKMSDDSAQLKREEVKKKWLSKKENVDFLKSIAHLDGRQKYKLTKDEELKILNDLGLTFLKTEAERMVESAESSFNFN